MSIEKFSLVRRLDTGELGIYIYFLREDDLDTWHKMSFPSQREWYGKEDNFVVVAPSPEYKLGDKVKACVHGSLSMTTFRYSHEMKDATIVDYEVGSNFATIHVNGRNKRTFKGFIYPAQLPNKAFKASLDK